MAETPLNALLNHFVQALVLSSGADISEVLGVSVQAKSLAVSAGSSTTVWDAVLIAHSIEYAAFGLCFRSDGTAEITRVGPELNFD